MPSRRNFVKQSALLSASFFLDKSDWAYKESPIGVQLYTLRSDMQKDPRGTLEQVAKLGYKQVETFGYGGGKWFGFTPQELATILKDNGLTSPSGHVFSGSLFLNKDWENAWQKAIEDASVIGQEYMVIPWLEEKGRTIDNYKRIAEGLNKAAEYTRKAGKKTVYHNHDFEFVTVDGQSGFDILTKGTDAKQVFFELDIYWAVRAGRDPIALFQQYPHRFPLWHVKDMDKTEKKFFTEVGNGVIDFSSIFKKAGQSGMKHFFVEQDVCPGPPLESIGKSIAYLKKNIVK